jgi:hypothetical protein
LHAPRTFNKIPLRGICIVTVGGGDVQDECLAYQECLQETPFPPPQCRSNYLDEFRKQWRFPNCIQYINGKHTSIKCPQLSGSVLRNYKQLCSVVMQPVAHPKYNLLPRKWGGGKEKRVAVEFAHISICPDNQKMELQKPERPPLSPRPCPT